MGPPGPQDCIMFCAVSNLEIAKIPKLCGAYYPKLRVYRFSAGPNCPARIRDQFSKAEQNWFPYICTFQGTIPLTWHASTVLWTPAIIFSVLKVVEFSELDGTAVKFYQKLFHSLLCDRSEEVCRSVHK